ncbi:hypothetical protein BDM02DRAFT_3267913 [Thelephora ganbajun]|uniref:Uncharacterized protein n=1 Tax=Thelephora ganbajun TaxID=370292 RepID=A0ACB6ZLQ7_THEGA|nr:hypothetical protein BDM02DRAFT_3267913 [Thelephora ganbajun]
MARDFMKIIYIIILCLTIVFAIVELGLASDLIRELNRTNLGFSSPIRPRTRYLVFCSSWGIIAGVFLVIFMALAEAAMAIIFQVIVPGRLRCRVINIINSTMAFAWINWSFVTIGLFLALLLAFFGREEKKDSPNQMGVAPAAGQPASTTPAANGPPPSA